MSFVLLIGIGNEYRRDDAAGLIAVRYLATLRIENTSVLEHSGEGTSLLERWRDASAVILIDAVHSGSRAGTLYRFDAHHDEIPAAFFHYSTHAIGVAEAIMLARTIERLPKVLIVFGIEGANFGSGCELTSQVAAAMPEVVKRVQDEIRRLDPSKGR